MIAEIRFLDARAENASLPAADRAERRQLFLPVVLPQLEMLPGCLINDRTRGRVRWGRFEAELAARSGSIGQRT